MELNTIGDAMFVMGVEGKGTIGVGRERPAIGSVFGNEA
jgi:hypothetical protein